jgi:hypothetical protein
MEEAHNLEFKREKAAISYDGNATLCARLLCKQWCDPKAAKLVEAV